MNRVSRFLFGASFILGCMRDPISASSDETSSTTNDVTTTTGPSTEGTTTTTAGEATNGSANPPTTDPSAGMDTGGFICSCDAASGGQCDPWVQDCPRGEKCMPWANDGGNSWNATKCTPIDPKPKGLYEPCTVEGNGVSGIDDCDKHMMCWNVDPATNMGHCFGMCTGSEAAPTCEDPNAACVISAGLISLCLPRCNPLLQDCSNDQVCIYYPNAQDFVCVLDASGPDKGQYGDPCEYPNVCQVGLFCADAAEVPGCAGAIGCCSQFCDLTAGDVQCMGFGEGQECIPWYPPGTAPPGYEHVGACALPP